MNPGRLAVWLRGEGTDLPKHIIKAAAEKAIQAANDKRARRKARPQGVRP
jgi:hypothetical protein